MTYIDVSTAPERDHADVLTEFLELSGKTVLDVGCGEGRITRILAKFGATVTGIDPGDRQLERAKAAKINQNEYYIKGSAEKLPSDDKVVDIVVFFNSLHHVPVNQLGKAFSETHRVLKEMGLFYIGEPLAQGPQFELSLPFNDETEVRAAAYDAIKACRTQGFEEIDEAVYTTLSFFQNYEMFRENSISIKPAREKYFNMNDSLMRERFRELGEFCQDGWYFPQYIRINLLAKTKNTRRI